MFICVYVNRHMYMTYMPNALRRQSIYSSSLYISHSNRTLILLRRLYLSDATNHVIEHRRHLENVKSLSPVLVGAPREILDPVLLTRGASVRYYINRLNARDQNLNAAMLTFDHVTNKLKIFSLDTKYAAVIK